MRNAHMHFRKGKSEPANWHMDKVNKLCYLHTQERTVKFCLSVTFFTSSIDHIQQILFHHPKKTASVRHMLLFSLEHCAAFFNFSSTSVMLSVDVNAMSLEREI